MKKANRIRHRLLEYLYKRREDLPITATVQERKIAFQDIRNEFNQFTTNELLDHLHFLHKSDEIYCSLEKENSTFIIGATGINAFHEEKYLRINSETILKKIKDWVYIIATIVGVLLALLGLYFKFKN